MREVGNENERGEGVEERQKSRPSSGRLFAIPLKASVQSLRGGKNFPQRAEFACIAFSSLA
jgi:hypothetical protein